MISCIHEKDLFEEEKEGEDDDDEEEEEKKISYFLWI